MTSWHVSVKARIGTFDLDVSLVGDARPVALVGPNGSGKTTLLRVIAGAIEVQQAHVTIDDVVLESTDQNVHVPIERRRVGYVPQGFGLFSHLSVVENVAFGLSHGPNRAPVRERRSCALRVLEDLACGHLADRGVERLSGGEQQRVALARALVLNPELLLLDEPLAALDASRRRAVRSFLAERLKAFSRPSIIVTHDVRDVAAIDAAVVVLHDGRVVQQGLLDTVRANPINDFVAEFVAAG